MIRKFAEYTDVFFWDYKRMDNVNYNFEILEELFHIKKTSKKQKLLNKPIIILTASIIECVLYDFLRRVTQHVNEKIPGLDESAIDDTKKKRCDKFSIVIAHIKKHNYLKEAARSLLYKDLDDLSKLRNRVHIQDIKSGLDKNEYKLWIEKNIALAVKILERVCEIMSQSYPRPGKDLLSMDDFPRPWAASSLR